MYLLLRGWTTTNSVDLCTKIKCGCYWSNIHLHKLQKASPHIQNTVKSIDIEIPFKLVIRPWLTQPQKKTDLLMRLFRTVGKHGWKLYINTATTLSTNDMLFLPRLQYGQIEEKRTAHKHEIFKLKSCRSLATRPHLIMGGKKRIIFVHSPFILCVVFWVGRHWLGNIPHLMRLKCYDISRR